jgi:hypothetical protein
MGGYSQQDLMSQLAMADEHIKQSESHITEQRKRVDAIERANGDAKFSLALLQTFQQCLRLHNESRERILHELETSWQHCRRSSLQAMR